MYPNPQAALPLPPRPSLEQYKKRAKGLVNACRSTDADAIRAWTASWLDALHVKDDVEEIAQFAHARMSAAGDPSRPCRLADAQFVIARVHGFASWPKLAAHLESLARAHSPVSAFEAAANAVIAGDEATLGRLLREHPDLPRARSTREHNATLLIYVSANGVEGYRQKSPANAARITEMLLQAGAEVDAIADVYGGDCTALGLVATSAPPAIAGVQLEVIDVLLQHGARMDRPGSVGNGHALIRGCLANGQPEAAAYLVGRGAPLDLIGAAGLGRLDVMQRFVDADGRAIDAQPSERTESLYFASAYGREGVVAFLLDHGMAVDTELHGHGAGHTGLHVAAFHGHVETVRVLLGRGANVEAIDQTWKTPPLWWALTGWKRKEADVEAYYDVVAQLVRAGATVHADILESDAVRADPKMLLALTGK